MTTDSMITHGVRSLLATGLAAMLVACGGGGSSSDDGSGGSVPVATRGVITQLGSIYVNGVKYETPNGGSYSNDDSSSTVADFKVGQIVSLRGRRNDDGATGTADEVEYEAEIEGAASGGAINNVTILITPRTNSSEIPGFGGSLSNGTRYEVSGIWLDNNTLEATFIKEDDDSGAGGDGIDEIKGFVEAVNSATSFDVRGVTYNYGGAPVISANDYVEVHFTPGTCTAPPNVTCTATSVELEDDFFDQADGLEIEIEGAVDLDVTGCPAGADFKIDMTCIDWDNKPAVWMDGLTGPDDIVEGSRVEAEGHMNSDLLVADKIKGRGNRVRVSSVAGNVNTGAGSFELVEGNIDVTTMSGMTAYEDGLTINNIDGQEVEVRGVRTGLSSMLAVRIKRTGLSGGGDRHEVRAEVDEIGADPANDSITVMGITAVANANTELEVDDVEIAPGSGLTTLAQIDAFLGLVDDDSNAANGPRDVIEIGFNVNSGGGSNGSPYNAEEIEIEEEDD